MPVGVGPNYPKFKCIKSCAIPKVLQPTSVQSLAHTMPRGALLGKWPVSESDDQPSGVHYSMIQRLTRQRCGTLNVNSNTDASALRAVVDQ